MTVDPNCAGFVTTISGLATQRDAIKTTLPTLSPADRWAALAAIGDFNRQIAEQQAKLDECQRQHAAAYHADVTVLDTTASTATREARLWKLDPMPNVVEAQPLTATGASFSTPPDGVPLAITVHETGNPAVLGVDFNSGPLDELPRRAAGDPDVGIEIVVGPHFTFTQGEIDGWLDTIALPYQTTTELQGDVPGTVDFTVSELAVTLGANVMTVGGTGTAVLRGPLWGAQVVPFQIGVPLRFVLPVTPASGPISDVMIAGAPTFSAGGTLGAILSALAPFLRTAVGGMAMTVLRDKMNEFVEPAVAAGFGLGELPPGVRVTLRRVQITPSEVRIEPALGAFGNVLSTFVP